MARSRLVCEPNDSRPRVKAVRSQRSALLRAYPSESVAIASGAIW